MGKRRERESAAKLAASQKAKCENLGGPSGTAGGSDLGDSRGGHSNLPHAAFGSDDGQHGPRGTAGGSDPRDYIGGCSDLPPPPNSDLQDGVRFYEVGQSSDFGGGAHQRCYSCGGSSPCGGGSGPCGGGGSGPPGDGGGGPGSGGGSGPSYFFAYAGPNFHAHAHTHSHTHSHGPSYHDTHIHTRTHSSSYQCNHTHTYSSNHTHIGSTPTYESTWISQMQVFAIAGLAISVMLVVGLLSTHPSESMIYYACLGKAVLAAILCAIMMTHMLIKFLKGHPMVLTDYGDFLVTFLWTLVALGLLYIGTTGGSDLGDSWGGHSDFASCSFWQR